MLKTTKLFKKLALKIFKANNNKIVGSDSGRANETIWNSSKNLMHMLNIRVMGEPNFLTLDAKRAFNHLRLVFIKALIF